MPEVAKMCEPEADFGCTVHVLPCTMLMEHPLLTHRDLGESYLILLPSPDDPMCHHTAYLYLAYLSNYPCNLRKDKSSAFGFEKLTEKLLNRFKILHLTINSIYVISWDTLCFRCHRLVLGLF
jgi:hypothetical protein